MNQKLLKLNGKINEVKNEIRELIANDKLEEAKTKKIELENLQEKFNIMIELEEEEKNEIVNKIEDKGEQVKVANNTPRISSEVGLGNIIKNISLEQKMSEETREIYNSMTAGNEESGGLTIPVDISTKIKQLRRSQDALENYVNNVPVSTLSGKRVIEKIATMTPFDNVDEEAQFPDLANPVFESISYQVVKKGGILKLSYELLANTAENLTGYVIEWISKKSKLTRNLLILDKLKAITEDRKVTITDIDSIKDVFNVSLDPAIAINSIVLTNQNGLNWLDKLKDADGRYLLQQDITEKSKRLLFGTYPVVVVSNNLLPNSDTGEIPFFFGDLKEAITIFDREQLTIEFEANAGDNWSKDIKAIKVREMLDVQAFDKLAVIQGGFATVTAASSRSK